MSHARKGAISRTSGAGRMTVTRNPNENAGGCRCRSGKSSGESGEKTAQRDGIADSPHQSNQKSELTHRLPGPKPGGERMRRGSVTQGLRCSHLLKCFKVWLRGKTRRGSIEASGFLVKRKDCPAGRAGTAMKLQNARALSRCRSRGREFDSPSFRQPPQRCTGSGRTHFSRNFP